MIILIAGATGDTGKRVVENLLEQNCSVRALVKDISKARERLGNKVELVEADIASVATLKPEIMMGVSTVIYCPGIKVQVQPSAESFLSPKASNLGIKLNFPETSDNEKLATYEGIKNLHQVISQCAAPEDKLLFNFANPRANLQETWGAVDDGVMGGVSQSNILLEGDKAVFSGIVSTDNNGGFASVRTRNFAPPLDLSDYGGIELRVIGDGKRYKFITRCEGEWDGVGYCYSFDTVYNFPTVIRIPFADLIPVFRAKTVREAGQLDSSKVYSMQLMLSKFEYDGELNPKFEPGSFSLQVEYLKAYGKAKFKLLQVSSDEVGYLDNLETGLAGELSTAKTNEQGDILIWKLIS